VVVNIELSDPGLVALYLSIYMFTGFALLALIFLVVRSRKRRVSTLYLSGEPEEVVREPFPGPAHFYWGFMKRFARRLYDYLLNRMHTGSLQDWVDYMFSWYGLLVLISIILGIIYYVLR
jgi:hypothetical protein